MTLFFSSGLERLTEHNSSFDKGILRICYTGVNRNGSMLSKDVIDRCIESIYNCPIVCRYDRELDEIGAHDVELVKKNDGSLKLVNVTDPIGVIPESARTWYEKIEEEDGQIHEYLCAEVLLWKRQEAYQKVKGDGVVDHSMEISVQEGSLKDGIFVIDRFEFTAFCLLGSAEPCFESSALMIYSQENFKKQFTEMMREFKESMNIMQSSEVVHIDQDNNPEGGNEALDEKMMLMEQYGLTAEMIDFDINDFSVEELNEKFKAIKDSIENVNSDNEFALAEQFRDELIDALEAETVDTEFGSISRYWYVDYDADASEVYCYDQQDWKLYGFPFAKNGDSVIVDFKCKKRMKHAIVPFDEGEQDSVFARVYSCLTSGLANANSDWESKYESVKQSMDDMCKELDSLKAYKADIEATAAKQEREGVFERFEDLVGVEAFESLRENCDDLNVDDIEEKCYAIRGRQQTGMKFSVTETKSPKLPIEKSFSENNEPYGGVFTKYGIQAD